jgi:hemolysin-activating ACP:hemolysin acyltransferase
LKPFWRGQGLISGVKIMADDAHGGGVPPQKTVSQVLGEITWLLTQSPLHKQLFIGETCLG